LKTSGTAAKITVTKCKFILLDVIIIDNFMAKRDAMRAVRALTAGSLTCEQHSRLSTSVGVMENNCL